MAVSATIIFQFYILILPKKALGLAECTTLTNYGLVSMPNTKKN